MNVPKKTDTAIITGASAGIGRATAHRFAKAGARIGLIARDERALDDVKNEIIDMGGDAAVAPADVSDAEAFTALGELLLGGLNK